MSNKVWAHIEVWVEYDPETQKQGVLGLFDAIADAAHDAEPEGADIHASASFKQPPPDWA